MTDPDATFVVQFWRRHFASADWMHDLEDAACDDLNGRSVNVKDYLPESILDSVCVRVRPVSDEEMKFNGRYSLRGFFHAIEFSLFGYDKDFLKASYSDVHRNQKVSLSEFFRYAVSGEFEEFCQKILFLTNICYSAALHCDLSRLKFQNADFEASPFILKGIGRNFCRYDFLCNKITPVITLDDVLEWSKICSGIWGGEAKTRVEKAVSFLSHTMSSSHGTDPVTRLIWATAALEALACDNSNSVSSQLQKRLPSMSKFVPFRSIKNGIKDAYGFRSRLLHGDLSVHNAFVDDGECQIYSDDGDENSNFLQMLLISCIWSAISERSVDFEFQEIQVFK